MFQKVHLQLTLLCTGITAVIMIIMSLCYLYVSESGLHRNQFQAFSNDINTISTNLEQQTVISVEWLSKMEAQGNYFFFVLDNGTPFLFNQLNSPEENAMRSLLLQESLDVFENQSGTDTLIQTSSQTTAFTSLTHSEYEFVSPSTNIGYFAGKITMESADSALEIIVLSSMLNLENQIHEQRLRFLLIDIAAVMLLGIFSWFFTGWLLEPIVENQKKQALFVASASHELRTPLSVILSAAECCTTAPPERREGFLRTISAEGMRVSSLVNDMLTLSQSDTHRFSIQKVPIELDTLLMNSYESFVPLAQEKSLSFSVELPEDVLPPCNADPERISQVVSILLHNAISYTPEHGAITLSLAIHRDKFHIIVTDNGIGISDEDKKKIFDRFYRAEKSRSMKDHFGLGLSIAHEIVKSHGGSIAVSDAAGGGSCFTVVL